MKLIDAEPLQELLLNLICDFQSDGEYNVASGIQIALENIEEAKEFQTIATEDYRIDW